MAMATSPTDRAFLRVLGTLNESQARWYVAQASLGEGWGGVSRLSQLTGLSRTTITKGLRELSSRRPLPTERVRRAGGGRPALEESDQALDAALQAILEETTAGDPMSPLRWTSKSTARLAEELSRQGHPASQPTVYRRLQALGYSLQANAKTKEEGAPPERDAQFRYINRQVKEFLARGEPVLSIDAKKKERVGEFKNPGRTWRPKGEPDEVNVFDYPPLGMGTAVPYGAYDVGRNRGFVNVGMNHETADFAVESLRRWWRMAGRRRYPKSKALLLCADGGGSNGSRHRAWKYFLQKWADEVGLDVTVCHYPPGTSKWNKIEHRLFSYISLTWRGRPLVDYETVVSLIGATRTKTGLRVKAVLDTREYATGEKITDKEMAWIKLEPHKVHPQWNYTITPH